MRTDPPALSMVAPNCAAISREFSVSSPCKKFLITDGLLLRSENMAQRCEIDLSGAISAQTRSNAPAADWTKAFFIAVLLDTIAPIYP